MQSWLTSFEAFSLQHAVTLAGCAVAMVGAIVLGRRWRDRAPGRERAMRIGWSVFVLVFQAMAQRWWFLPENFAPRDSMPLHICDLVIWFTPFALVWQRRLAFALLYFWGVGLSTAAFVYPTVEEGVAQTGFWLYWVGHVQIVGTGLYVVAVMRFRPSLYDLMIAVVALVVYIAILLPIDFSYDLDYGYLGPVSEVISFLGSWPLRVFILLAGEAAAFVALWAPYAVADRHRRRADE